jgi:hypothetical protein
MKQLQVLYSQIAIFDPSIESPFNDWTERHVAQGFSWRPRSVSFSTLIEACLAQVTVRVIDTYREPALEHALRAIVVPFTVCENCRVEVASITESFVVEVPSGQYALCYSSGLLSSEAVWIELLFGRAAKVEPAILKADPVLHPSDPPFLGADPA